MEIIKNDELTQIMGGALNLGFIAAIVAISVVVVGIIDGLMRPLACNKK